MKIQLSEHFTYKTLIKFTIPTIIMMIFTSIYEVVDGIFVSNCLGADSFTALNNGLISAIISFLRTLVFQVVMILVLPLIFGLNGIWLAVVVAEILALIVSSVFLVCNRKKYKYA